MPGPDPDQPPSSAATGRLASWPGLGLRPISRGGVVGRKPLPAADLPGPDLRRRRAGRATRARAHEEVFHRLRWLQSQGREGRRACIGQAGPRPPQRGAGGAASRARATPACEHQPRARGASKLGAPPAPRPPPRRAPRSRVEASVGPCAGFGPCDRFGGRVLPAVPASARPNSPPAHAVERLESPLPTPAPASPPAASRAAMSPERRSGLNRPVPEVGLAAAHDAGHEPLPVLRGQGPRPPAPRAVPCAKPSTAPGPKC